jgi:hypothetical protein
MALLTGYVAQRALTGGRHLSTLRHYDITDVLFGDILSSKLSPMDKLKYARERHACLVTDDPTDTIPGLPYVVTRFGKKVPEAFIEVYNNATVQRTNSRKEAKNVRNNKITRKAVVGAYYSDIEDEYQGLSNEDYQYDSNLTMSPPNSPASSGLSM